MKSLFWLWISVLCLLVVSSARGETYLLSLRYQPSKEFPSLQEKIGSTLGMAPFRDERPDPLYIGRHTSFRGTSIYFKSDPSPLEKALAESLSNVLSQRGVKIIPISQWDGKPESLQDIETDSVLMIEIKKFWAEGKGHLFRTNLKTGIHLVIHLGVKKENRVFTKNLEVQQETTFPRLTKERMEEAINRILTDLLDPFFSNPY